jgi:hypothetical protein
LVVAVQFSYDNMLILFTGMAALHAAPDHYRKPWVATVYCPERKKHELSSLG